MRSERLLNSFGNIADKYIIEARPKTVGKTINVIHLFRKPAVFVAAILAFLLLCAFTVYVVSNFLITFPANEDGKSEYNMQIFDTSFMLSVSLPEGIMIDFDSSLYPDGISGVFSNISIINANGVMVGCVGYNIYDMEQLSEIAEDEMNPLMIYNQIGLGAHYRFTVREKYDIVNNTEELTTAITDVYNDMDISPEERINYSEEEYNYGIVSYCKILPVYIAFDFDKGSFTQGQIEEIARSIEFAEN